jgi:hypothetical protein
LYAPPSRLTRLARGQLRVTSPPVLTPRGIARVIFYWADRRLRPAACSHPCTSIPPARALVVVFQMGCPLRKRTRSPQCARFGEMRAHEADLRPAVEVRSDYHPSSLSYLRPEARERRRRTRGPRSSGPSASTLAATLAAATKSSPARWSSGRTPYLRARSDGQHRR